MSETTRRIHFVSALPHSGGDLLTEVLKALPQFYAERDTPVAELVSKLASPVTTDSPPESQRTDVLIRRMVENYYEERPEQTVFDANQCWTPRVSSLMRLFPESKMICVIRDVAWIVDSMERERAKAEGRQGERAISTIFTRAAAWTDVTGPIGSPLVSLRRACQSEFANRIMLVSYDGLVRRPQDVLRSVCEFLGESFEPENVEPSLLRRDEPHLTESVLPTELFKRCSGLSFWNQLGDANAARSSSALGRVPVAHLDPYDTVCDAFNPRA